MLRFFTRDRDYEAINLAEMRHERLLEERMRLQEVEERASDQRVLALQIAAAVCSQEGSDSVLEAATDFLAFLRGETPQPKAN